MRWKCRIGLHAWVTHTTSDVKENVMYVYTWNFCDYPDCKYSEPLLLGVTKLQLAKL